MCEFELHRLAPQSNPGGPARPLPGQGVRRRGLRQCGRLTNHTGFPITYADQLRFNRFLAAQAHNRHLSVGLKNDPEQVLDLLPDFDWATVEECFQFQECASYRPFADAGKPVIAIEYTLQPEEFCQQAQGLRFNAMKKRRNLDAFRISC